MFRLRPFAAALVVALLSLGDVAGAQARCSYNECALRVDQKRIVRGESGEVLVRLGPYTGVANRVDWLSDSARVHAARYGTQRSTAATLRILAWGMTIASGVIGYQVYHNYQRQADLVTAQQAAGGPVTARLELERGKLAVSSALSLGAFATGWMAGQVNEGARTELSRAIWWHNRQLR